MLHFNVQHKCVCEDVASLQLFCAGNLSSDCSYHIADAIAVNNLIKALATQRQLETVEVAFDRAFLPLTIGEPLDLSDSEEEDLDEDLNEKVAEYDRVSSMTAKLFHPAWMAVCKLMEHGDLFRLR